MGNQTGRGTLMAVAKNMRPYILMVCLQFGAAGQYIVGMLTLNHGMNRYVLITYRNAVAALVLAPFAVYFERKLRPKMTISIFLRIMALGCLEPILDQGFVYLGMQYTSASFTSAIMNAVPAVTFVIALIFRIERIRIKEVRSHAKVFGTLITLGGTLLMTLFKGPVIDLVWTGKASQHRNKTSDSSDKHWITGTLLILVGCVAWSTFYLLQATTIKKYPAELTLTSSICLAGTLQSLAIALAVAHQPGAWSVGWDSRLLAPLYLGVVGSGITYYVQGRVMKTRGPVFVTAFNPLSMTIVAALGPVILGETLYLGSVIGGIIIAVGLYSVVWGKSKDYGNREAETEAEASSTGEGAPELPITAKSAPGGNKN